MRERREFGENTERKYNIFMVYIFVAYTFNVLQLFQMKHHKYVIVKTFIFYIILMFLFKNQCHLELSDLLMI